MGTSPPDGDNINESKLNLTGDFETQVDNILQRVRLTRFEVENLQHLIDDLENALQNIWPGCEVHPFGSIISGLGIKTSDVDCFVQLPKHMTPTFKSPVILARNVLKKKPWIFDKVQSITGAKVPILKFIHIPTNCYCDVNFTNFSGVQNSTLVGYLINLDRRVLPLTILIKYWSVVYSFTGTNKMPTYSLIMMVIFYLQAKSILPSVKELQDNVPEYIVDGWNTAFNTEFHDFNNNNDTLYELLGGFFQYYSTFDFGEDMITPYLGYPINKQMFNDIDKVPCVYKLYKERVSNKVCPQIKLESSICVQDPFEHNRNCAVAIFPKLANEIMSLIHYGTRMFREKSSEDFLRALFDTVAARRALRPNFSETPRKITKKITKTKPKQTTRKLKNSFNCWFQENRRKTKLQDKQK